MHKEVSKEEFFKFMGPKDVHPCPTHPNYSTWKYVGSGIIVGFSYPGWKNPGDPEKYIIV